MRIWWCQEHQARDGVEVFNPPLTEESRWCVVGMDLTSDSCRMVPMRLIADDAETVETIARVLYDSRWGDGYWVADRPAGFVKDALEETAGEILAALSQESS